MSYRKLKQHALSLLQSSDWPTAMDRLIQFPPRQIINPLFGLLYHTEPLVRWRAVTAMGVVVAHLADQQMESARVIMRRFMWNLNDESGGIGWGSPESMGEIMARQTRLAQEYGCLLVSYADPSGNYLEHPVLQRGVLWGWGRLGRIHPNLFIPSSRLLVPFLLSSDPHLRGLAAWAAVPLKSATLNDALNTLMGDSRNVTIYNSEQFRTETIGQIAQRAVA